MGAEREYDIPQGVRSGPKKPSVYAGTAIVGKYYIPWRERASESRRPACPGGSLSLRDAGKERRNEGFAFLGGSSFQPSRHGTVAEPN